MAREEEVGYIPGTLCLDLPWTAELRTAKPRVRYLGTAADDGRSLRDEPSVMLIVVDNVRGRLGGD